MSDDNLEKRSLRVRNVKRSSNNDLLNSLSQARKSGTVFRKNIEFENVYDYVDEDEYKKLKDSRIYDNFIEGDLEDYDDDGEEIFYHNEAKIETDTKERKRYKPINSNISRKKSKLDDDLKQPKLISTFLSGNVTHKPKSEKNNLDDQSFVNELMEQIEGSKKSKRSTPKQSKIVANKFINTRDKSNFNIDSPIQKKSEVKLRKSPSKQPNTKKSKVTEKPINDFSDTLASTKTIEMLPPTNMTSKSAKLDSNEENDDFGFIDDMDFDDFVENENKKDFITVSQVPPRMSLDALWEDSFNENKVDNDIDDDDEFDTELFNDKSKNCLQMFWLDAYYDMKIPGVIFLFGKTFDNEKKCFVNCCIKVCDLERRLYFLIADGFSNQDVYGEVSDIFNKNNINKFRCKAVVKKYAFQIAEVPDEADYLMVQYNATLPALPLDVKGKSFSHVFGVNTSCLENFILDLKLKGPCWLNIDGVEKINKVSTCALNYGVKGLSNICKTKENIQQPPLTVLSFNIKTILNPNNHQNELISIGYVIHRELNINKPPPKKIFQDHAIIITHPKDGVIPYDLKPKLNSGQLESHYTAKTVTIESCERGLLNNFLTQLQNIDPDLLIGHSVLGYQLDLLLQRCNALNISGWSRLGRLRRSINLPKVTGKSLSWIERMATAGRLICDISISARELVRSRSYELPVLIKEVLPSQAAENWSNYLITDVGDPAKLFLNTAGIKTLLDMTMGEAIVNLHLMHALQVLPLAFQITSICGNLLSRTLIAGKSERNEYLLLHAFTEKNYITPDKEFRNETNKDADHNIDTDHVESSKKSSYLGGLVLEPKKGLYENFILLMDFNSLYPSIIQEFNICFTTIDRRAYLSNERNGNEEILSDQLTSMIKDMNVQTSSKENMGILPIEIRNLVEARRSVKTQLRDPKLDVSQKVQLDIRQKALKITANSMYGCLGFSSSRFKAKQLAALITGYGRNILQRTKYFVESGAIKLPNGINSHLDIVYGDTDSIMVNTGLSDPKDFNLVMEIGQRIKSGVNKKDSNIELDIDGVFKKLLLLKKKKYAALCVVDNNPNKTKQELKGLDIVRRDWCRLAVDVGHEVVTMVLESNLEYDALVNAIRNRLKDVQTAVRNGQIEQDRFVITRALTKNPEAYSHSQGQPHVQVALRANKFSGASGKKYKAKDTVEYVICCGDVADEKLSAVNRAYSILELQNKESGLSIDTEYYLGHQVHPVVSRLLECIEGLESSVVAECLGLDSRKFSGGSTANTVTDNIEWNVEMNKIDHVEEDNFLNCLPLSLTCFYCKKSDGVVLNEPLSSLLAKSLLKCIYCGKDVFKTEADFYWIQNRLTSTIRNFINNYYKAIYECNNCKFVIVNPVGTGVYSSNNCLICPYCSKGHLVSQYTASQLYNQLQFYKKLFEYKDLDDFYRDAGNILYDVVGNIIKHSKYHYIDCSKMPFSHIRHVK